MIREKFAINLNGKNVTPKPLNPLSYEKGRERQISLLDMGCTRSKSSNELDTYQSNVLYSDMRQFSRKSVTQQSYFESTIVLETAGQISDINSIYNMMPIIKEEKMPEYVSIVLRETSTEFIFELPSKTADKDTNEGNF